MIENSYNKLDYLDDVGGGNLKPQILAVIRHLMRLVYNILAGKPGFAQASNVFSRSVQCCLGRSRVPSKIF